MGDCPHISELIRTAAAGKRATALAGHLNRCGDCGSFTRTIRERADSLSTTAQLEDCDAAEVLMSEIDVGLRDPDTLAPLVAHLRTCSLCYQDMELSVPDPGPDAIAGGPAALLHGNSAAHSQSGHPADRPVASGQGTRHRDIREGGFDFPGTDRFEVRQRLGSGGMGVVYEAYDRKNGAIVALKTLRNLTAKALFRFKNEFRARQDLQHENLVSLGELFEHHGEWFYTMELVRGLDFANHVRHRDRPDTGTVNSSDSALLASSTPNSVGRLPTRDAQDANVDGQALSALPGRCDVGRLLNALRQLCLALRALHNAGKVHRDIKPSNIIITPGGRLVLLDFGLVSDLTGPESTHNRAVGTPAYMAPEQATGTQVGPPADLYSVGVLLYEAITGERPFSGTHLELYWNKRLKKPVPPRRLAPETPRELDALCTGLLSFSPHARPTTGDVLACVQKLDVEMVVPVHLPATVPAQKAPFAGRKHELAALRAALDQVQAGAGLTILCSGVPGVGKTALIDRFARWLRDSMSHTVVLPGRCYERESVPYNAFDKVIDALSRYLVRLPPRDAAGLLPRRVRLLADVFPVLRRVEAIEQAPQVNTRDPATHGHARADYGHPADSAIAAADERTMVFTTLRELLARIADRRPLVILIDDVHWADADSRALLQAIMAGPQAPAMLLVATTRQTVAGEPNRLDAREWIPGPVQTVSLAELSDDEAVEVAQALLVAGDEDVSSADILAREAGGHPVFLRDLIREASLARRPFLTLEQALNVRIERLHGAEVRLVEIVAVAGAALPLDVLSAAATVPFRDVDRHLAVLRAEHLVCTAADRDHVAIYHHRVRGAVLARMDPSARRACHRALATELENAFVGPDHHDVAGATPDLDILAVHWQGAGDFARASQWAARAARQATRAQKLDRAARLYQLALDLTSRTDSTIDEHSSAEHSPVAALSARLGEVLADAGHCAEAATAFRDAARFVAADQAVSAEHYLLLAAENLVGAGRMAEGLTVLERALSRVGLDLPPQDPRHAMISLMAQRARLRLRGDAVRRPRGKHIARDMVARTDALWHAGLVLSMVDLVRRAEIHTRHLIQALETGESFRAARALIEEAALVALRGKDGQQAERLIRAAQSLAGDDSARVRSLAAAVRTGVAVAAGHWSEAHARSLEAEALSIKRPGGFDFTRYSILAYRIWSLFYSGALDTLSEQIVQHLDGADESAVCDIHLATMLKTGLANIHWLAGGDVEAAREVREEVMQYWSAAPGFLVQHKDDLLARHHIHLYTGDSGQAWRDITENWPRLEQSLLLKFQLFRVECVHARGRSALAEARGGTGPLLGRCERDARRLARENSIYSAPLGELLRAGIAHTRRNSDAAIGHLRRALLGFESAEMALYAAAARRQLGILLGGDEGRELVQSAEAWMNGQDIADPDRMTAMLAPGFAD
ncbi:MAG: AAA family ATPase [Proteobacteria bacterium]|nr:AAA family ATPase [Pseudomonadota bacterium]